MIDRIYISFFNNKFFFAKKSDVYLCDEIKMCFFKKKSMIKWCRYVLIPFYELLSNYHLWDSIVNSSYFGQHKWHNRLISVP